MPNIWFCSFLRRNHWYDLMAILNEIHFRIKKTREQVEFVQFCVAVAPREWTQNVIKSLILLGCNSSRLWLSTGCNKYITVIGDRNFNYVWNFAAPYIQVIIIAQIFLGIFLLRVHWEITNIETKFLSELMQGISVLLNLRKSLHL